ncbi:MAG TPA: hypothetical protein VNF24_02615 [Candidatus Acidoferrales bacterium]|nr:hypothetical protein [Candidatus Acidoferrales bacterium]
MGIVCANCAIFGIWPGAGRTLTKAALGNHLRFVVAPCLLLTGLVHLGHRVASAGGVTGVDRLGLSMLIGLRASSPVIGLVVLHQVPRGEDLIGIGLVIGRLAGHRDSESSLLEGATRTS